jgi:hypothetical protein
VLHHTLQDIAPLSPGRLCGRGFSLRRTPLSPLNKRVRVRPRLSAEHLGTSRNDTQSLCNLSRDMPPSRLAAVLFWQVLIDQIRTSARVESFMTVGTVSGRGNVRDQSGRGKAWSYAILKGLTQISDVVERVEDCCPSARYSPTVEPRVKPWRKLNHISR